MGSYATAAEVADKLAKNYATLYTPRGLSAADTTIVEADIAAAEADLHSYLAGRYAIPVTETYAVAFLKGCTLTLVEELAYGRVPGIQVPQTVTDRIKDLRARLLLIAQGKLTLGNAAAISTSADGMDAALIAEAATPVFTRTTMAGY